MKLNSPKIVKIIAKIYALIKFLGIDFLIIIYIKVITKIITLIYSIKILNFVKPEPSMKQGGKILKKIKIIEMVVKINKNIKFRYGFNFLSKKTI